MYILLLKETTGILCKYATFKLVLLVIIIGCMAVLEKCTENGLCLAVIFVLFLHMEIDHTMPGFAHPYIL